MFSSTMFCPKIVSNLKDAIIKACCLSSFHKRGCVKMLIIIMEMNMICQCITICLWKMKLGQSLEHHCSLLVQLSLFA